MPHRFHFFCMVVGLPIWVVWPCDAAIRDWSEPLNSTVFGKVGSTGGLSELIVVHTSTDHACTCKVTKGVVSFEFLLIC